MKTRPFSKLILIASIGVLVTPIGTSQVEPVPDPVIEFEPVPVDALPRAGRIGGRTNAVAVVGDVAYIGVESRLIVVDVSNPLLAPQATGQTVTLPDTVWDIYLAGDYLYVAAGDAGLRVIDVFDPGAPLVVGILDTPGRAKGVHVAGLHAYVADGNAGLQVIDISNPGRPVPVATVNTEERALDVFVDGDYAYVAAEEAGLRVIDVFHPDVPVEIGVYNTLGDANGVHVTGGFAYLAAGGAGLRVVDVSDPTDPAEVGAYENQYGRRVFVNNERAYLATERNGLWVIDVSDPTAPVAITNKKTVGSANGVFVADDHAYVADGVGALSIASIAQDAPSLAPSPVSSAVFLPLTSKASPSPLR